MKMGMKLIVFTVLFWSTSGWCAANPADTVVPNFPFKEGQLPLTITPEEQAENVKLHDASAEQQRAEATQTVNKILGPMKPAERAPDIVVPDPYDGEGDDGPSAND